MLLRMALPHKGQVCAWSECPHCKEDTSEVTFTSGSNIYIHADGWWRGGEFTTDGLFVCVCWVLWFACRLLPFGRWKLIVLNVVAQSQSQTAAWKQAKLFCTHIVGDIRATALAEYRVYKVRGIVVIFNTIGRPLSHHPSPQTWLRKKTEVWYCFAWLEHKQIAEPQMQTDGRHLSVSDGRNCAWCFQE